MKTQREGAKRKPDRPCGAERVKNSLILPAKAAKQLGMSISPRFLDALRDRLTLSDIIGQRVRLSRAGREFKGCCPFHKEKTPSFYVNDEKQFYHCFGCGAHGDAVGFVMQHDNLSFPDAVEILAAKAGMEMPKQTPQDIRKAKKQQSLHALIEETTRFFEASLQDPANREALGYLQDRGIAQDTIARFRLGFAPADGRALYACLKAAGFDDKDMIEAGVCARSKRDGSPYAFFRDRIIFPVTDRRGRVVAFGGRILPDHLRPPDRGDYKPPKYINSSDTPLFHKGRMLYGDSHARQAAGEGQAVIVVEGYLDVISCFSAGYRGAVAPLGTALTEEQIQHLWKMIPENRKIPIMCFDGDDAGRRAAARACERLLPLLQPDHSALFAFLPEGQDPDSLIRAQGKKAFDKIIADALPLSEFLWMHHTAGRSFTTPESKAGLAKTLEQEADKIADRAVQQYYRQAFRERLYQSFRPARPARGKSGSVKSLPTGIQALRRPVSDPRSRAEQILMAAFINHPDVISAFDEQIGLLRVTHQRLDLLRQAVLNIHEGEEGLDAKTLQNHLSNRGFDSELRGILSESVYVHAGFVRPETAPDLVVAGVRETMDALDRTAFVQELKEAGQALSEDFSAEKEERIMALRNVHKAQE